MVEPRRAAFNELRYIPVVACVLLVVLRLSIGWHFLYEGLWKYDTLDTKQPWTAAGFLKNAQGPFRSLFREHLSDDPDELNWLNEDAVSARWNDWAQRFANHHQFDEAQRSRLDTLLNGPETFRAELEALPAGVAIPRDLRGILSFDAKAKRLILKGDSPLMPSEKAELLSLAVEPAENAEANPDNEKRLEAFRSAVIRLAELSERFSYRQKLRLTLGPGDPERVRHVFANFKGTLGERAPESIDAYYRGLLEHYQRQFEQADVNFQREHLAREWENIQKLRAELTGPVKALEASFQADARKLLTREQLANDPLPQPWTTQRIVDAMTIWSLIVLGLLLLTGFGTRAAAVIGACMVFNFYLVWPPWPGVPVDPGPEHAFIINKNMIEILALLAIAALPTGQWFGVDRLIWHGWKRLRGRRSGRPGAASIPPAVRETSVATT